MSLFDDMEEDWNVSCECGWYGQHEELHCHPSEFPSAPAKLPSTSQVAFDRCPVCNSRKVKLKGEKRFYCQGYTRKDLR